MAFNIIYIMRSHACRQNKGARGPKLMILIELGFTMGHTNMTRRHK